MPFVNHFGYSEEEYDKQEQQRNCVRPEICPLCGGVGCLIGHGYYFRKSKGGRGGGVIWIKRWLCKLCHRTTSVLPDFLFAFRHYVVETIQAAIEERFWSRKSWAGVKLECACRGAPALRTMQRWCTSFAKETPQWLRVVQDVLEQQGHGGLRTDPNGNAMEDDCKEQALLNASECLLAQGKACRPELAGYGRKDRMRFLWLWSSGRGLGRLV